MRVAFVLRAAEIFPWFLRFVLPKFAEISLSRFSLRELISNYDVETNFLGWKFERYGRQKTCAQIQISTAPSLTYRADFCLEVLGLIFARSIRFVFPKFEFITDAILL